MPKFILCLPPARLGPMEVDSQCSGNIASFRWISSNLIKTRLFINRYPTPTMPKLTLCLHLLAENPAMPIPNVVAILPIFDGFLPISSKLYTNVTVIGPQKCQK